MQHVSRIGENVFFQISKVAIEKWKDCRSSNFYNRMILQRDYKLSSSKNPGGLYGLLTLFSGDSTSLAIRIIRSNCHTDYLEILYPRVDLKMVGLAIWNPLCMYHEVVSKFLKKYPRFLVDHCCQVSIGYFNYLASRHGNVTVMPFEDEISQKLLNGKEPIKASHPLVGMTRQTFRAYLTLAISSELDVSKIFTRYSISPKWFRNEIDRIGSCVFNPSLTKTLNDAKDPILTELSIIYQLRCQRKMREILKSINSTFNGSRILQVALTNIETDKYVIRDLLSSDVTFTLYVTELFELLKSESLQGLDAVCVGKYIFKRSEPIIRDFISICLKNPLWTGYVSIAQIFCIDDVKRQKYINSLPDEALSALLVVSILNHKDEIVDAIMNMKKVKRWHFKDYKSKFSRYAELESFSEATETTFFGDYLVYKPS